MTIDQQIQTNNLAIEANNAKIADLKSSGNAWIKDASDDVCNQINAKKKAECSTEKARKHALGQTRLNEAKVLEAINENLIADNKALTEQRKAEGESMLILAQQGQTPASVRARATADAEAAKTIADAQSSALLAKTAAETTTLSQNGKVRMYATIGAGLAFLLIIGFIAYKKLN